MSKIKVRLKRGNVVSSKLKPQNGIKAKNSTVYLFDPTLIDGEVQLAQDWAIKTDGLVEEDGVGVDYSAKAYAIGGTGTTTNNAKYYAEQAGISETSASNSATSASGSASSASSSASLAKDWATKTDGTVDGVDYSSKYYAQQITPIATDITTVAGIASDVTTVSNNSTNVTTVAGNTTNINKVASDINRVNLVADDIDSVHTVAVDISTVIDVANNKTNIDAVAGNATNINAVAGNETNINAVAGNASNINTVASDATNIDAVAGDLTNIDAVANDLTNIDNASTYANNAHTWAEGTDEQVSVLGGEKSAKGWAARAKEIADGIGSIYKPAGSIAFESLPALSSDIQGNVYNITNDFTTTSDFVEGAGKSYPAGTNVVCIDIGSGVYKWDVLAGIVDLSGYVPTSRTVNGKALSSNISLNASDVGALPDTTVVPTINSTNNYVPYRSGASTFSNSSLLYNSNAMAFTGRLHVGSSSPASYYNKGRFTVYDNTPSQQVSSIALLNYGGGGGCGVAIDMYNTSANGGIPSGRFGLIDNGNYSGYLQLQVKKSGAQSNPLLTAMNVVPVPAANSLTTCLSFGKDEFNNVLFDLHKPEASLTTNDTSCKFSGSGTTYYVSGSNKFSPRLMVAVGDIVSFDNFTTEATVTGVVSNSTTCQITTNVSLGSISSKQIYIKKAYFKITDENNNVKVYINPYGKFGIGTSVPNYDLDVNGTINASTDIKINGTSLATVAKTGDYDDLTNKPTIPAAQVNSDWNANSGVAQILNKPTLATVATSGAYSDLSGTPTIPTVNNPTITLTQGGVTKGSFTLNQSTGDTIELDAGWGMPSGIYEDFTTAASGAQYTAPGNGYFLFETLSTSASRSHLSIQNTTSGSLGMLATLYTASAGNRCFVPAKTGDKIQVYYSNANMTLARFIYCVGG